MRTVPILVALVLSGCAVTPVRPPTSAKVMVFGDASHSTYLGCLSCSEDSPESVFNPSGRYGSCGPLDDNVRCRRSISKFGASSLSALSACAPFATEPPVIVDNLGRYFGRFSVSTGLGHSDSVCRTLGRFENQLLCDVAKRACGDEGP